MLDDVMGRIDYFQDQPREKIDVAGSRSFWFFKRLFDICISLVLLPPMIIVAYVLILLNPVWNRGTLFFIQERMGKDCRSFKAIKFRTMVHVDKILRGHEDPIESDRITRLGKFLRSARLDELPQIINVLIGDMSLIGPRPDYYPHALKFSEEIPGYRARHAIRPGISGLAQVRLGYAEGLGATRDKTHVDQYYIEQVNFNLDTKIAIETIVTVLRKAGL